MTHLFCRQALACLLAFGFAAPAAAQFADLAKRVPDSANVVALVNMDVLLASPFAKTINLAGRREAAYKSGVSFLPPDTRHAILSMDMDFDLWVPMWESAVIDLDHQPDMGKIAAMSGGSADLIQGIPVVQLPSDAYVAKFGPSTAAFMAPANRQATTRWVQNSLRKTKPDLSLYLSEALHYVDDLRTPVVVAIDMKNAYSPVEIRTRLLQSRELIERFKLDEEQVIRTLSGLRGVTLGITFIDKPFGKVKIDFEDEINLSPEIAKAAMIHVFSNHGVLLDEFEEWTPKVSGKSISLEGTMTESGLKRVSSLFNRPPSLRPLDPNNLPTPKSAEEQMKDASLAYYHQVEDLLKDLKKTKPTTSMGAIGVWLNKYASKIDQLSVLHVDPELVNYGAFASDSFRAAYNSIRSGAAKSRIRQVNTPMQYDYYTQTNTYGYTYRDGYFGAGVVPWGDTYTYAVPDVQAYANEKARVRTEERVASGNDARQIVQGIEKATAEIRRKMTQKYSVDF